MDSATRKAKLDELKSDNSNIQMTGIPLLYGGNKTQENVYKIPLEYLIYNKHNGRIGTKVKSFEKQKYALNPEEEDHKKIIEDFLYKSKVDRNKTTMESLFKNGQQRYGIITSDGVIVDGNRRAMLLNKLYKNRAEFNYDFEEVAHCAYFLAIILPNSATAKDIQRLETTYQMGEDDKLDYNPIEKYLKCQELKENYTERDIAGFMGETELQIKEWLSILKLMEDYLDTNSCSGIYTQLEKTEGQFKDLHNYLTAYIDRKAKYVYWPYEKGDIADLKIVCFDYIRARYEGKEFRDIGNHTKKGSIFAYEEIWKPFLNEHKQKIPQDAQTVEEKIRQSPEEDLSVLLKTRDIEWKTSAKGFLEGNLKKNIRRLEDNRDSDKPYELLSKAYNTLRSVDVNQKSFYQDVGVEDKVKEINKLLWNMKKRLEKKKTH